jgi:GDP-L-fucose synthase
MIRRFCEAKVNEKAIVEIWGTGSPKREFLHVDDLAEACLFLMLNYSEDQFVNIGSGEEVSIKELADMIKDITGFKGTIQFDTTKPDGTPRKLLDGSKLAAKDWRPKINLRQGLETLVRSLDFGTLRQRA